MIKKKNKRREGSKEKRQKRKALAIGPDGQVKTNNPCRHHSNLYLFLSLFSFLSLFFIPFPRFIFLSLSYLFSQLLNFSTSSLHVLFVLGGF